MIFYVQYSTLLHLPPHRFHCVGENAGIEPRTVATTALAIRRSNNSARSHPHSARSHPLTARFHPHSARSHPLSARFHPHSARSHPLSARFPPHSARSHPHLIYYYLSVYSISVSSMFFSIYRYPLLPIGLG
jgi:hypothetical protein